MTQVEEDAVRHIVKDFMSKDLLFTALDISNEVKKVFSHLRHKEVRDIVRSMFDLEIQPAGWAVTDIEVTLQDSSKRWARLYYPLSASWDLEALYDDQKRSQTSSKPTPQVNPPFDPSFSFNKDGDVTIKTDKGVSVSAPSIQAVPPHQMWKQMFDSKPSLFPSK